jgi:hypothetical protein
MTDYTASHPSISPLPQIFRKQSKFGKKKKKKKKEMYQILTPRIKMMF